MSSPGSLRRVVSVGVTWTRDVKERLLRHCDALLQDVLAAFEGDPFAMSLTRKGERSVTSQFALFPGARVIDENHADVVPGEDIRDHVGQALADYKRPRCVAFVPELRLSPTGKPDLPWAREVARGAPVVPRRSRTANEEGT